MNVPLGTQNQINGVQHKHSQVHFVMSELAWRSGSVMDCHATAWGSIPGGNGIKT